MAIAIVGTGSYLPERVVTNLDIEATTTDFDSDLARGLTLDAWARRKLGADTRHYIADDEATSDMATVASRRAITDADIAVDEIDLIVVATFTSDYRLPQAAALVQANLRSRAKFIQVDAACSGFVDALTVAESMMARLGYRTALVVGADAPTRFNDPQQFLPAAIFGDGAGAVILRQSADLDGYGLCGSSAGSDGHLGDYIFIPAGGSKTPISEDVLRERKQYCTFRFPLILEWAVEHMSRGAREAVARAGIGIGDVSWVVPHQASLNIVTGVARELDLPMDMFIANYPHTGNTAAASVPIALDEGNRRRLFGDGDWVVMSAAGAGMAWGAVACRWYDYEAARTPTGKSA